MNALAWLNLLNLLIIPLGYLIHDLGKRIDELRGRVQRLEREAITKPDFEFWRGGARTARVQAHRHGKSPGPES